MALCPGHDDKHESLSVGNVDGKVLLNCFAGCETADLLKTIGLELRDLYDERKNGTGSKRISRAVATGRATLRVSDVRNTKTRKGQEAWRVKFIILSGQDRSKSIIDTFLWEGNAAGHLKSFVQAVGLDTSGQLTLTHDLVMGRACQADIEQRDYEGKARSGVVFASYRSAERATYDYQDEAGTLLYQVVRLEPKGFFQRRPNGGGGWHARLGDIRRVPYRIQQLIAAPKTETVYVVEGEKDVENLGRLGLLATTCPQGAGKWGKLDPAAVKLAFESRPVVVLPDNDDPGRKHAAEVAASLLSIAASVNVLELAGLKDKGDVSDWLAAGGTKDALLALLLGAAPVDSSEVAAGGKWAPAQVITNYREEEIETEEGRKVVRHAVPVSEIVASVLYVTNGWPKRLGGSLFWDHEGRCELLETNAALTAYLHARATFKWQVGADNAGQNFLTREELYSAVLSAAEYVEEITAVPLWPQPPGIYVTKRLKIPENASPERFFELLRYFKPDSEIDQALIQALALTPFWGGKPGSRPLFVVTGPEGIGIQGTGKTTLVEVLAILAGGYIAIERVEGKSFSDGVAKQILTESNLSKRVVLFDNLSRTLESQELASLITSTQVTGRPAFERAKARANYFTWAATAVSPELDEDLADRCVVLHLAPPQIDRRPNFRAEVEAFMDRYQLEIVGGALTILKAERTPIIARHSRYPTWDDQVLGTHSAANEVLEALRERRVVVNTRDEAMGLFLEELRRRAESTHRMADSKSEFHPKEIAEAWQEANGGQRVGVSWVMRKVREAHRRGVLPAWFSPGRHWEVKKGMPWVVDKLKFEVETEYQDTTKEQWNNWTE
jgi:5S rRNA maturation endonuclease (ribonuclease M5)